MKVTNIIWDTDGISIDDLPEEVIIDEEIEEDEVADWLSDVYGWCVYSFVIESSKDYLIYDECVKVDVERDGESLFIPFYEIQTGDYLTMIERYASEDAHESEDPDYNGWVVYDNDGNGWFPEDFGAALKN